ncbi:MAG TPA: hypothetical protein PKX23_17780 [Verrucomicrobiota bacterium]|jgi:hypothetical protein|nr:hypothetical protein [Verrucomicrobiota bacterium]HRT09631.1 hypothetical protein [Candidatus Paceibacterota bacterium]HRT57373.1 hypothetical protein [Candidatus Paceibacterota bacterium]
MTSVFIQALRSRWLALAIHGLLWLLLYLVIRDLGGRAQVFQDTVPYSSPARTPVPVSRAAQLFASTNWPTAVVSSNLPGAFFTRHFVPPPKPPPPAPTTRKVDVTYLGYMDTADQVRHALVRVADALVITRLGESIATNNLVAEATMQALTLTNLAGQTNLLPLSVKKEIEVPIK